MCKMVRCVLCFSLCFSEIHSNLSELEAEVLGFHLFYLYFLIEPAFNSRWILQNLSEENIISNLEDYIRMHCPACCLSLCFYTFHMLSLWGGHYLPGNLEFSVFSEYREISLYMVR